MGNVIKPYNESVLNEGGFKVILSNQGKKLMFNPNPRNENKKEVPCLVCGKLNKNKYALCTEHNKNKKENHRHIVDWVGRIVPPGYDLDDVKDDVLNHYRITEILIKWMKEDGKRNKVMDDFIDDVLNKTVGNVPDATTLQKSYEGEIKNVWTPDDLVKVVRDLVDKHFPEKEYKSEKKLEGIKFRGKKLHDIPIRIVVALLILAWTCEESNRGDAWFCKINKKESKYGNAYMPSVYYFMRRYTNASEKQAEMCLRH